MNRFLLWGTSPQRHTLKSHFPLTVQGHRSNGNLQLPVNVLPGREGPD